MRNVWAKLVAWWKWLKERPVYLFLAAIGSLVILYGSFSAGVHAIFDDARLALTHKPPPPKAPVYALQFANFDAREALPPKDLKLPRGQHVVELNAKIRSIGDPVYVTVGQATASVEEKPQLDIPRTWNALPLNDHRIFSTVDVSYVAVPADRSDLQGRVDWTFKFGPDERHMTHELHVKGQIFRNFIEGRNQWSWMPDADSAKPFEMTPTVLQNVQ